ncbi:uncharacterized protein CPUR_06609 [Claviceps purpurea 20.1]|uniref:Uncharacterized protein n=1 Tax=Claviceps purpurea (strain 20.1) TaxID=1111077 RepID=M1W9Y8_CLAP2|nr:hypothetical protein E4U12_007289 [Claviceps purpurea]KAG6240518.1 hypothetical protein E4U23_007476 [Claviceps purpurea]CCE32745.1 uncharacterized protein CPUR_06609 [Claviceps purpurea 20.1]
MIFCKEQNKKYLRSLKAKVQRDREAGEYIPPNFDSILQSLDEMAASNDAFKASDVDVADTYRPGRKEYEILQAYNLLIKAGGRPICTLEDINHVSEDPERHLEILAPWIGGYPTSDGLDWKDIFRQQLLNWRKFRAWQRVHRDVPAQRGPMHSPSGGSPSSSSTLEAHAVSTRERLERYGFTKPFCFNENAEKQDDWTTWVEYMSYECHYLEDCSRGRDAAEARASTSHGSKGPDRSFYDDSELGLMNDDGSSASETTTDDAIDEETMRLNDAKHHRLILRWITLQEPEIAAVSLQQASSMGKDTAMAKNGLGRFKRLRDGSLRGSVPGSGHLISGDCPNDDASEQEAKRCRTSA